MNLHARTQPTTDTALSLTADPYTREARVWVFVNSEGYKCLTDGHRIRKLHRVVWERHFGPIPPGHELHHKNGDRLDNDPDNLELLTAAEHHRRHRDANRERATRRPRDERGRWTNSYPAKPRPTGPVMN